MNTLLLFLQWITGFLLFAGRKLLKGGRKFRGKLPSISVIIPARNEEQSLPFLLTSLKEQTVKPNEIIVVDDDSEDRTYEIAKSYGVKVIRNKKLEEGWTGKSWAVWNGFMLSKGEVLIFLDADVRLSPTAIEELLYIREKRGGVVSVFPYHYTERFYERLSLLFNFLGSMAFSSPFEKLFRRGGMCGAVVVCTREDYLKIGGHYSIRKEVVEDMAMGRLFEENSIPVETYLGYKSVSFRMYPGGYLSLVEGFTKNTAKGALSITYPTLLLLLLWFTGLFASGTVFWFNLLRGIFSINQYSVFYFLYSLQLMLLGRYIGRFGILFPLFNIIPSSFFLLIFLNSIYRYYVQGIVSWKDRIISIRGH